MRTVIGRSARGPAMPHLRRRVAKRRAPYALVAARVSLEPGRVTVDVPVRLENENNKHEHWRRRHDRSVRQKSIVRQILGNRPRPALPCVVELTPIRPRLMDSDGSDSSAKFVRDAVAEWLGCGDGPKDPITWIYGQEKGAPRTFGVRIVVREVCP